MFDHSEYSLNTILFDKKTEIENLYNQVQDRYTAAIQSAGNKTLDEAFNILDIMINDKEGRKKEIFDSHSQGGISPPDFSKYEGMSDEQLKAILERNGSQTINGLLSFQETLGSALDKAWRDLGQSGWKSMCNDLLHQYAIALKNKRGISGLTDSELKNQIIRDFTQHSGLIKLMGSENSPYKTSLRNLTLLAAAIPELKIGDGINYSYGSDRDESGQIRVHEASTYSEFFNVIQKKINSTWKNIIGGSGEMAAAAAELAGSYKVRSTIADMHQDLRNMSIKVKETGTNQVSRITSTGKEYFVQQKGDITVKMTADNVKITYGISVKNYARPIKNSPYSEVFLGERKDLIYLAKKAGLDEGLIVHAAASHGKDDSTIPETIRKNTKTTSQDLKKKWDDIKSIVTYRSFMDILAGESMRAGGDNVLVLNIKGTSFTLKDIVRHLQNERMWINRSISGSSRETLTALNQYQKNKNTQTEIEDTRITAYNKVINALKEASVGITLKFLSSLV